MPNGTDWDYLRPWAAEERVEFLEHKIVVGGAELDALQRKLRKKEADDERKLAAAEAAEKVSRRKELEKRIKREQAELERLKADKR